MARVGVRAAALVAAILLGFGVAAAADVKTRPDGLHYEAWIKNFSFLDLREDLAEAKAAGKGLVVLFEAIGCGSCKRLHEENFRDAELVDYIKAHFDVIQINLFGDNAAIDFSGQKTDEKQLAQDYLIHFTPTTLFLDGDGKEAFRVAGFIPAKFYKRAFEYVVDRGYERGILFPRWQQEQARKNAGAS